jgi:hypothetical protein
MDKRDYALTLTLDTGENYAFAKLGYDTTPFADTVEKQIRALREKTLATVNEIDPALTAAQASQIAKIAPSGAAVPIGQLTAIAPSFAAALESKITATRAVDSYTVFKKLCDPSHIWVGFHRDDTDKGTGSIDGALAGDLGGDISAMLGGLMGGVGDENPLAALTSGNAESQTEETDTDTSGSYLLWLIAPSPDGQYAAVEFAEANSATFIYRTGGDFAQFARQINRALEAINFKREVIRLSDEELRKSDNADYYMAVKRTKALQFARANFSARIIHSSPESWKRNLMRGMGMVATEQEEHRTPAETTKNKFCGQCGAEIAPDVKFCGMCGTEV